MLLLLGGDALSEGPIRGGQLGHHIVGVVGCPRRAELRRGKFEDGRIRVAGLLRGTSERAVLLIFVAAIAKFLLGAWAARVVQR